MGGRRAGRRTGAAGRHPGRNRRRGCRRTGAARRTRRGKPALSAADLRRPAGAASGQRHSVLSNARQFRPTGGAPADCAARARVACDRDAAAGAVDADGAVAYRSGARRDCAADRPRRRLSGAVGRARRAHRRGRRALDRGGRETSQRQGHRRHRARRRFQPARDRCLPHRADRGRPLPQPSRHRDITAIWRRPTTCRTSRWFPRTPQRWSRPRCRWCASMPSRRF